MRAAHIASPHYSALHIVLACAAKRTVWMEDGCGRFQPLHSIPKKKTSDPPSEAPKVAPMKDDTFGIFGIFAVDSLLYKSQAFIAAVD